MFIFNLDLGALACELHLSFIARSMTGTYIYIYVKDTYICLNVQYSVSNYPIILIFIHMIEWVISILHIKYLSNLIIL